MKKAIHRRRFLKQAGAFALALPPVLNAAGAPAPATAAAPTIVRTRELMAREPNPSTTASHVRRCTNRQPPEPTWWRCAVRQASTFIPTPSTAFT